MPKSETSLKELLYEVRRVAKSREVLTEKRIRQIYRSVMQDLNGYIADAYVKYSDDEGRLTLSQLKSKASYARFLEEVAERVDALSPALRREMLNLADDVYSRCWRSMTDAVQNAADLTPYRDILGDSLVRPEVMRQAVKNNISKLTLPPLLERNRQDVIYQIQQVLGIGLMNGDRYDTMAKKITERLDVSYSKAVLTARTESHRNQEAGMLDCAKEISSGVEGSGLIYTATWRTMQDERVRPNHRYHTKSGWKTVRRGKANHEKMEGKIIRVGDRFDLGDGVYAEAPGSSGVAAHDCNCRCYLEYALMTPEEFVAAGGNLDDNKVFTNADDSGIINTYKGSSEIPVAAVKEIPEQVSKGVRDAVSKVSKDFPSLSGYCDGIDYGFVENGFAENRFLPNAGRDRITLHRGLFSQPEKLLAQLKEDYEKGRSYETDSIYSLVAHELGHNAHIALALKRAGLEYGEPLSPIRQVLFQKEYDKITQEIYLAAFPNDSSTAYEIWKSCSDDLGSMTYANAHELIAQAFGNYYYGLNKSGIAKSIVKYFMKGLK